MLNEHLTFYFY